MMNRYETVFIATPVLSEAQMKEAVKKVEDFIRKNEGEVIHSENWGLKKLAYPIQKKSTGFYHLIEFSGDGELLKKLETEYKRDERIIRFLTVKMEKYHIEYSERKRNKKKDTEKKSEE